MNMKNENFIEQKDKTKGKLISILIYVSYVLICVAICCTDLPLYEMMFRLWVISYLVVIFNLFFDENPPKLLNINGFLNKKEEDSNYEEYMDNVISMLNITMKSIKFIEKMEYNIKYEEEYKNNFKLVKSSYNRLKKVKTPNKYRKTQESILRDIETFIENYEDFFLS